MSSSLLDHPPPELSPVKPSPTAKSPCRAPPCAVAMVGTGPAPVLRPSPRCFGSPDTTPHLDSAHPLCGLPHGSSRRRALQQAADPVLALDDADIIWGAGGVVASSLVDMYVRALSTSMPASRALSRVPLQQTRPPVTLADWPKILRL
jgi:hypothetical protein